MEGPTKFGPCVWSRTGSVLPTLLRSFKQVPIQRLILWQILLPRFVEPLLGWADRFNFFSISISTFSVWLLRLTSSSVYRNSLIHEDVSSVNRFLLKRSKPSDLWRKSENVPMWFPAFLCALRMSKGSEIAERIGVPHMGGCNKKIWMKWIHYKCSRM